MLKKIRTRYNSIATPAKAALWFSAASVLQKGISFVTVPLFTRILTTEEYGIYSLYLSWFQILTIITSLYLYYGVYNNALVKFTDSRNTCTSALLSLTLSITGAVFGFYLLFRKCLTGVLGLDSKYMYLMFIEMAVSPALYFYLGAKRFDYDYKRFVYITVAKSFLNPVLGLLMVYNADDKAFARIVSVVVVEVMFCGNIMIRQFMRGRCFFHKKYWAYGLKLAIPLVPHYLSGMILNQGDRVMINQLAGKSEVAFYSIAYNIGMLVQLFTTAIVSSITPWIYKKMKEGSNKGVKERIDALLFVMMFLIIILMILSPELVMVFGSSSYRKAAYVIPPVAASVFFIFLYDILAIPQFYFEETRFMAISSASAAGLNILLNYIFIQRFGFVAAGYTTLACYVLFCAVYYFISSALLKKHNAESLCNTRRTILLSVIVIVCGCTSSLIFNLSYIRYLIVAAAILVVFRKRFVVIQLLKRE